MSAATVATVDPLAAAREHAADAYFYAGEIDDPDKAIAAFDQAMAELRIARAMLVARAESRAER